MGAPEPQNCHKTAVGIFRARRTARVLLLCVELCSARVRRKQRFAGHRSVNGCLETIAVGAGRSPRGSGRVGQVLSRRARNTGELGHRLGAGRGHRRAEAFRRRAKEPRRPPDRGDHRAGGERHHQRQAFGDRDRPRQQFGHRQALHIRPADQDRGDFRPARRGRHGDRTPGFGGRGNRARPRQNLACRRRGQARARQVAAHRQHRHAGADDGRRTRRRQCAAGASRRAAQSRQAGDHGADRGHHRHSAGRGRQLRHHRHGRCHDRRSLPHQDRLLRAGTLRRQHGGGRPSHRVADRAPRRGL